MPVEIAVVKRPSKDYGQMIDHYALVVGPKVTKLLGLAERGLTLIEMTPEPPTESDSLSYVLLEDLSPEQQEELLDGYQVVNIEGDSNAEAITKRIFEANDSKFNWLSNNCEQVAGWIATGKRHIGQVGTIGCASAVALAGLGLFTWHMLRDKSRSA